MFPNVAYRATVYRTGVSTCSKDALAIYDGGSKSSPMIGRFCDYAIDNAIYKTRGMTNNALFFMENSAIVSTNNELFLHFETDQDQYFQERGFEFEYSVFGKFVKKRIIGNARKYLTSFLEF